MLEVDVMGGGRGPSRSHSAGDVEHSLIAIGEQDPHAVRGKAFCNGASDATGPAGDERRTNSRHSVLPICDAAFPTDTGLTATP